MKFTRIDIGLTTILAVFLLVGCKFHTVSPSAPDDEKRAVIEEMYEGYREEFPEVPALTPRELSDMKASETVVVVDVRTPEEREISTIPGAISREEFEKNSGQYTDRPIVTYCTIGYRSGLYTRELREQGLDAYNLQGSILSWVHAGYPVVAPDGEETNRVHVYGERWDLLPEGFESVY